MVGGGPQGERGLGGAPADSQRLSSLCCFQLSPGPRAGVWTAGGDLPLLLLNAPSIPLQLCHCPWDSSGTTLDVHVTLVASSFFFFFFFFFFPTLQHGGLFFFRGSGHP